MIPSLFSPVACVFVVLCFLFCVSLVFMLFFYLLALFFVLFQQKKGKNKKNTKIVCVCTYWYLCTLDGL